MYDVRGKTFPILIINFFIPLLFLQLFLFLFSSLVQLEFVCVSKVRGRELFSS